MSQCAVLEEARAQKENTNAPLDYPDHLTSYQSAKMMQPLQVSNAQISQFNCIPYIWYWVLSAQQKMPKNK